MNSFPNKKATPLISFHNEREKVVAIPSPPISFTFWKIKVFYLIAPSWKEWPNVPSQTNPAPLESATFLKSILLFGSHTANVPPDL